MIRTGSLVLLVASMVVCAGGDRVGEPMTQAAPASHNQTEEIWQTEEIGQTLDVGRTQIIANPAVEGVVSSAQVDRSAAPESVTTSTVAWASVRLEDDVPLITPKPVRIVIAAIGVDASVEALGVMPDSGQMEVPENVDEVG